MCSCFKLCTFVLVFVSSWRPQEKSWDKLSIHILSYLLHNTVNPDSLSAIWVPAPVPAAHHISVQYRVLCCGRSGGSISINFIFIRIQPNSREKAKQRQSEERRLTRLFIRSTSFQAHSANNLFTDHVRPIFWRYWHCQPPEPGRLCIAFASIFLAEHLF